MWVRVGRIAKAHGVRGELKFVPDSLADPLAALLGADNPVRLLFDDQRQPTTYSCCSCRNTNGALLVRFDGVSDRDDANALRGAVVEVDSQLLPALGGDSYYLFELRGVAVKDETGAAIGVVTEVFDNGGQDLLVIEYDGGERLLPHVAETVLSFDRDAATLLVRPPDGIWDE